MRIGEILIRQGLITAGDVDAAMARRRMHGGLLGANLIALGRLTVDRLVAALQDQRELATLPVCEKQLANWERSHGADHPNTSRARYSLARLQLAAGDAATALDLSRAAFDSQKIVLGAEHPWTKDTARLIAAALDAINRTDKAVVSVD